ITHALLMDPMRGCYQKNLCRFDANSIFEDTLPVITAAKPQNVSEHLVAKRRQLRAKPKRERIVFRAGVTDEQRLARRVAHDSLPDSSRSLEESLRNASRERFLTTQNKKGTRCYHFATQLGSTGRYRLRQAKPSDSISADKSILIGTVQ